MWDIKPKLRDTDRQQYGGYQSEGGGTEEKGAGGQIYGGRR